MNTPWSAPGGPLFRPTNYFLNISGAGIPAPFFSKFRSPGGGFRTPGGEFSAPRERRFSRAAGEGFFPTPGRGGSAIRNGPRGGTFSEASEKGSLSSLLIAGSRSAGKC